MPVYSGQTFGPSHIQFRQVLLCVYQSPSPNYEITTNSKMFILRNGENLVKQNWRALLDNSEIIVTVKYRFENFSTGDSLVQIDSVVNLIQVQTLNQNQISSKQQKTFQDLAVSRCLCKLYTNSSNEMPWTLIRLWVIVHSSSFNIGHSCRNTLSEGT